MRRAKKRKLNQSLTTKTDQVSDLYHVERTGQWASIRFDSPAENYKNQSKGKVRATHRNEKEFKNITQRDDETDAAYLRRVNRITHESAQEAQFEAKYGVEVVRNKKTGEIKLKKKPTNEIDERLKQNMENHKRARKTGKSIDAIEPAFVLSSDERKKMVKKIMAEKKAAKTVAAPVKDFKKDEFKFGEVVHAPPTLTTPRRAQKAETVPRVIFASHEKKKIWSDHNLPI